MWKLVITQQRKSSGSEYTFDEKVEFESDSIYDLSSLIVKLSECEGDKQTEYKIYWEEEKKDVTE